MNRYVPFRTRDFKSRASASFATRAGIEALEKTISVHGFGDSKGSDATTALKNQCRADEVIAPIRGFSAVRLWTFDFGFGHSTRLDESLLASNDKFLNQIAMQTFGPRVALTLSDGYRSARV